MLATDALASQNLFFQTDVTPTEHLSHDATTAIITERKSIMPLATPQIRTKNNPHTTVEI